MQDITMKINFRKAITMAVDEGVSLGWNRSHKHTNNPDPASVKDAIAIAILDEIDEWVDFEDEE
jgi:hypothetical protein